MHARPRLTPAIADVRRAVRLALADPAVPDHDPVRNSGAARGTRHPVTDPADGPELPTGALVLVALSGGPDSLALAAALAFEAPRAGLRAGAVIVDHGLQDGSAAVAERAADQARGLGLDPVRVVRVAVSGPGGPEAAARDARYAALDAAADELAAAAVVLGHTLDDQAETVLLGLARGSGPASLQGMAPRSGRYRRPLLGIRRATTVRACADAGLEPWDDPHNADPAYARVRVRRELLPVLETELGPGVAEALARTAEQLREDAAALDDLAAALVDEHARLDASRVSVPVAALAASPAAIRQRAIRIMVQRAFGVALSRVQTRDVARLVTDWRGQDGVDLPGVRVNRRDDRLEFRARGEGADGER